MGWLVVVLHVFIGSTVAGSLVVAALVIGYDTWVQILTAVLVGYFMAAPVSWIIAKRLVAQEK